jgi:hypothetical protein
MITTTRVSTIEEPPSQCHVSRCRYGYDSGSNKAALSDFYSVTSATADQAAYSLGTSPPDYHQGFGTVQLSNILPVNSDDDFELYIFDAITLGAYESWRRNFTVDTGLYASKEVGSSPCGHAV